MVMSNSNYWFYSRPINISHFHLVPESPAYCVGNPYKIGLGTLTNCRDPVDAKYWPRKATNMGGNSGVKFYPTNSSGSKRNFDLKAIYIYDGSTAEVWGYRVGIGWWVWYPLAGPGRWYFTNATNMTEMQVFDYQQNGTVVYDNIEIGIYPYAVLGAARKLGSGLCGIRYHGLLRRRLFPRRKTCGRL